MVEQELTKGSMRRDAAATIRRAFALVLKQAEALVDDWAGIHQFDPDYLHLAIQVREMAAVFAIAMPGQGCADDAADAGVEDGELKDKTG